LVQGANCPRDRFAAAGTGPCVLESDSLGTQELFDLEEDPRERRNLAAANPDTLRELAARLEAWRERGTQAGPAEVSPEDREALRALGYVD
jgi:hypothetical protein